MDSSTQDLAVPEENPDDERKQKYGQTGVKNVNKVLNSGKTQTGPYHPQKENTIQAEEARNPKLIDQESPAEMRRKQKGE
jgi:hypothetical protein